MLCAVLTDIGRVEPLGQDRVGLDRPDLPCPADGVGQVKLQLRRVKSPFAGQFFPTPFRRIPARRRNRIAHRLFGPVPHFVRAETVFRSQRELDRIIGKAQILVNRIEQVAEFCDFLDNLVLAAEDMRIVLGELPHPHQAVQRAMRFVPVAASHFGEPQRQIAVRLDPLPENQDVRRTIHRLQRHPFGLVADDRTLIFGVRHLVGNHEHILAVFAPVPRLFPLPRIHDLRSLDLKIARCVEPPTHIGLKRAVDDEAIGVPKHRPMRFGLQMEQVHVSPDTAVIALGRFFQSHQMRIELLLVQPASAVNPRKLRIFLVAAPIRSRYAHQLERCRVELAGRGQMRPAAHIHPTT